MVNIFVKFESIIIPSKYRNNIFNLRKIILGRMLKDRESIFKKRVVGMNKGQQTADDIYIPLPGVLVLSINISYSLPIINIKPPSIL